MNEDRHIGIQTFIPSTFKTYHLNTGQSGNLSPPISCKTIGQHSLGRWWSLYSVGMSNKSTTYESKIGMIREQLSNKSFDGFVHNIAQYQAKLKVALTSCSRDPLNAQP